MTSIELNIEGDTTPEILDTLDKLRRQLEDGGASYTLTYHHPRGVAVTADWDAAARHSIYHWARDIERRRYCRI